MFPKQHIAELGPILLSAGLRHVVVCPGSRNAPLIQMFTSEKRFACHSIVDERSAGYVALGMARQLNEPVAVVTTSGTAVLNLGPSIAEAWYQHIPLLVFSADRPRDAIPQFTNQVVDQEAPFFSHTKGFYQVPSLVRYPEDLSRILAGITRLAKEACEDVPGPVHFNVLLDEPLYEPLPEAIYDALKVTDPGTGGEPAGPSADQPAGPSDDHPAGPSADQPADQPADHLAGPSGNHLADRPGGIRMSSDTQEVFGGVTSRSRILILAGMGAPDPQLNDLLSQLVRNGQVAVIAENIANMAGGGFIACPELALASAEDEIPEELMPELVISFGGQVVSKQLRILLQRLPQLRKAILEDRVVEKLKELLAQLKEQGGEDENRFIQRWRQSEAEGTELARRFLQDAPFSNITAAGRVLSAVPEDSTVHLGNSAAIRYSQLFQTEGNIRFYANRGTSGIDGCVSSAVGAAMVSEDLHLLMVGDLSFVYDSNALWNKDFPENLKIVVLNDSGGGIFRLLDGPDRMDFFEEFSITGHPVSLGFLSRAFQRKHMRADSLEELESLLGTMFLPETGFTILEIDTTLSENSRIFKAFIQSMQS